MREPFGSWLARYRQFAFGNCNAVPLREAIVPVDVLIADAPRVFAGRTLTFDDSRQPIASPGTSPSAAWPAG